MAHRGGVGGTGEGSITGTPLPRSQPKDEIFRKQTYVLLQKHVEYIKTLVRIIILILFFYLASLLVAIDMISFILLPFHDNNDFEIINYQLFILLIGVIVVADVFFGLAFHSVILLINFCGQFPLSMQQMSHQPENKTISS